MKMIINIWNMIIVLFVLNQNGKSYNYYYFSVNFYTLFFLLPIQLKKIKLGHVILMIFKTWATPPTSGLKK